MPATFKHALGARVAELRSRAGLTQATLAEKVGVTVETISRLERGLNVPGVATLVRVAEATGSEPHEVLIFRKGRDRKAPLIEEVARLLRQLRVDDLELARDLVRVVHARRRA
jgi:transcriptional regulator with XRE-family HTH domain